MSFSEENMSQIRELAELLKEFELTAIRVDDGDLAVELEKEPPIMAASGSPLPLMADAAKKLFHAAPAEETQQVSATTVDDSASVITSPMVGTFYVAPSPDEPPFVKVGQEIGVGQTVAIVEAMKMMNEITSEVAGVVIEVLASNGQQVEYGQPLFRIAIR